MSANPFDFQDKPSTPPPELRAGDQPPALGRLGGGSSLGSLAQAAREKQLNKAKWWLIIVGILSLLGSLVVFAAETSQLEREIGRAQVGLTPAEAQQQRTVIYAVVYTILIGQLLVCVAFIVCGALMKRYPVVMSVTAMTLFVLQQIVAAVLDPLNIVRGFIIKIILIFVLINAIKAAFAYQREKQLAAEYSAN